MAYAIQREIKSKNKVKKIWYVRYKKEKIFSLFEPYTEWISKGKAGVSQELGLRVAIVESSEGFILHHRVMEQETDDRVAVPIIMETKALFKNLRSCSFDKGIEGFKRYVALSVVSRNLQLLGRFLQEKELEAWQKEYRENRIRIDRTSLRI